MNWNILPVPPAQCSAQAKLGGQAKALWLSGGTLRDFRQEKEPPRDFEIAETTGGAARSCAGDVRVRQASSVRPAARDPVPGSGSSHRC